MVRKRRLTIEISRTINLGNYENVRLTAGCEEFVDEDSDIKDEYKRITDQVGDQLVTMEKSIVSKEDDTENEELDEDDDDIFGDD